MKQISSETERQALIRSSLRASLMLAPSEEQKVKHNLDVISAFMSKKDIPAWYRGKSHFQAKALNKLQNAIRDDRDQRTAHRVRAILNVLGLEPMVGDKYLMLIMSLSRGNDLAFLWFLMEMFYKTPNAVHQYNINEQLILTAIAHLDMVTTLRELDRILPPGHESKRQILRRERHRKRLEEQTKAMKASKLRTKASMPYFEKLEDPIRYGLPLSVKRPDLKANLKDYGKFSDKQYVPPNEHNRWYGNYKLHVGLRLVHSLLRDLLDEAITLLEHATQLRDGKRKISIVIREPAKLTKLMNTKTECLHHKIEAQTKRAEHLQREAERKTKLIESLGLVPKVKKALLQRVRNELERDIAAYRLHYGSRFQERVNGLNTIRVIGGNSYRQYLLGDSFESKCVETRGKSRGSCDAATTNNDSLHRNSAGGDSHRLPNITYFSAGNGIADGSGDGPNINTATNGFDKSFRMSVTHAPTDGNMRTLPFHPQSMHGSLSKSRLSFNLVNQYRNAQYRPPLVKDSSELSTPHSSECFFEAACSHKPYQFKYNKIFHFKNCDDAAAVIKEKCVKALSGDVHTAPKLMDFSPNLKCVASQCANNMRNRQLANGGAEQVQAVAPLVRQSDPYPPDMPLLHFYDCDNRNLMRFMLKISLEHMSQNTRFVLASMPESYKLPFLNEWICQRYGKRYSDAERMKSFAETLQLLNSLERTPTRIVPPTTKGICRATHVDYSCREYVLRKVNLRKQLYFRNLNNAIQEHTRILWFAMRGYQCTYGPQRDTFFAYKPSRNNEVKFVKPWRPSEKKNAKEIWERRYKARLIKNGL